MERWTIVLMYPDYIAENYGEETYIDYVVAEDLKAAIARATEEAMDANDLPDDLRRPEDWAVVFACRGFIDNEYAGFGVDNLPS